MSEQIPEILQNAWSVKTPREQQLADQIAPLEKTFLIKYAEYLNDVYTGKEFDDKTKDIVINEIIATARARIAVLAKEVNPSLTHAVVAVVLYLLSNILTNDHVKYKTQGEMMAAYPSFLDRPAAEKQNLFLTANWMSILFRFLPARKNKGIAMDIIPKFVEGNGAHYVTGGGQTQATRDRVFIYETEGECKPIKRLKRKSKGQLQEEEEEKARLAAEGGGASGTGSGGDQPRKKLGVSSPQKRTQAQKQAQAAASTDSISSLYFPLPAPFFHAQPLPIPVISPRSQSSFSQAAAVIANFGQVQPELTSFSSGSSSGTDSVGYTGQSSGEEPRQCYLDIQEDGTVVKKFSPRASGPSGASSTSIPFTTPLFLAEGRGSAGKVTGSAVTGASNSTNNSSSLTESSLSCLSSAAARFCPPSSTEASDKGISGLSVPPPSLTTGVSRMSSSASTFDRFVEAIGTVDGDLSDLPDGGVQDQLAMLREASADSDI